MRPSIRAATLVASLVALVALVALAACNNVGGLYCTPEAHYALDVTVVDSVTGAHGPFTNLVLVATTLAYKDSMLVGNVSATPDSSVYRLGYERSGTYALTVTADGYRPWTRTGIFVLQRPCHVADTPETAKLVAK
jgi:predicted small lipoprotein YifL